MMAVTVILLLMSVLVGTGPSARAQSGKELVVANDGRTTAQIVVSPHAGTWERQAAHDLQKYIGLMSGASPTLAETADAIEAARHTGSTVIVIGQEALKWEPSLRTALANVQAKKPIVRADALVVRRNGSRLYLAGSNDESHYFAVSWLLQHWGCRWYMPTEFGECVPERPTLSVGRLDFAYAPPFEIRHYWLSWNADSTGANEFRRRNFMTETSMGGMGHALGQYTKALVPPGKTLFNVSFSDPATAQEVARQIEPGYARGVPSISLAIEDGNYVNDSPGDQALKVEYDRYALKPSMTDAMLTLYNNVARILRLKYPRSPTKIGGMAYANVTLPPKKVTQVEPNLVMWLAPIDIDPNHGMDDPRSPPRREYRAMMESWAKIMHGRLAIYDYDQGMLVWRDLPDPSQYVFAQDVKHYARAGLLGVGTESRGATATTFLNLFFRGQLLWNPNADVDQLLAEFYPKFYGPAAAPMANYWTAIFAAWKNTSVTEHEFMAAPAIYTPELTAQLQKSLEQAEAAVEPLRGRAKLSRNEKQYLDRVRFTRLSFEIIKNYTAMVTAAARDGEYGTAAAAGEKALAAREELTQLNPTFTTYKSIGENGAAWFPGEVQQMKDLAALTDGSRGTLIARTPLRWSFHRGTPIPTGWTYTGMEGNFPIDTSLATEPATGANGWSPMRTDLYLQGQGVLNSDGQSYNGHYWYQTTLDLKADQTEVRVHLMFPGLFNETWLYVNGELVAHRDYKEPWWLNDYQFEWDLDLSGKLKPGPNVIALRGFNPHHLGGIFRRPFLYRPPQ